MIYPFKLDLQLFAEGAGDGAGAAGTGGSGVNPQDAAAGMTGVMQPDAAAERSYRRNPLAYVQYGRQGQQSGQQDDAAQWQEAKTRHKALYDAEVQQILRGRLRDADANVQTLTTLKPMLDAMAKQYGVNAGDHQALVDKYLDEDSLYEDEAIQRGMSVETVKEIHKIQGKLDAANMQLSQYTDRARFDSHLQGLMEQGEALKAKYPFFDLQRELQNETFARMTGPNGGLTVEQAYAALHHDELQSWAMQQAAQQSRMQAAQTMQANLARPRENASRGMAPPARVKDDPSKLSADDIRETIRRATAGAKIGFD